MTTQADGTALSVDDAVAKNLAASYAATLGTQTQTEPPPAAEPPKVETAAATTTQAEPEPVVTTTTAEPAKVEVPKTFEEILAERSNGKYKSWDDMQADLTPKELKFANEQIKRFNELAEKGVDVTSREFLELQSLDVEKSDALFERWKRTDDGKGLSDEAIKYEINKKYNIDEWKDKDPSELTLDDKVNKEKLNRDINISKEWLTNYKNERTLEKTVDPSVSAAMAKEAEQAQLNWEKSVDTNLVSAITKLSAPISYKDEAGKVVTSDFDFDIPKPVLEKYGNVMKNLTKDPNAVFGLFKDAKGNDDPAALFKALIKAETADERAALAYSQGAEKRALIIAKKETNTNYTATPSGGAVAEVLTVEQAAAKAISQQRTL